MMATNKQKRRLLKAKISHLISQYDNTIANSNPLEKKTAREAIANFVSEYLKNIQEDDYQGAPLSNLPLNQRDSSKEQRKKKPIYLDMELLQRLLEKADWSDSTKIVEKWSQHLSDDLKRTTSEIQNRKDGIQKFKSLYKMAENADHQKPGDKPLATVAKVDKKLLNKDGTPMIDSTTKEPMVITKFSVHTYGDRPPDVRPLTVSDMVKILNTKEFEEDLKKLNLVVDQAYPPNRKPYLRFRYNKPPEPNNVPINNLTDPLRSHLKNEIENIVNRLLSTQYTNVEKVRGTLTLEERTALNGARNAATDLKKSLDAFANDVAKFQIDNNSVATSQIDNNSDEQNVNGYLQKADGLRQGAQGVIAELQKYRNGSLDPEADDKLIGQLQAALAAIKGPEKGLQDWASKHAEDLALKKIKDEVDRLGTVVKALNQQFDFKAIRTTPVPGDQVVTLRRLVKIKQEFEKVEQAARQQERLAGNQEKRDELRKAIHDVIVSQIDYIGKMLNEHYKYHNERVQLQLKEEKLEQKKRNLKQVLDDFTVAILQDVGEFLAELEAQIPGEEFKAQRDAIQGQITQFKQQAKLINDELIDVDQRAILANVERVIQKIDINEYDVGKDEGRKKVDEYIESLGDYKLEVNSLDVKHAADVKTKLIAKIDDLIEKANNYTLHGLDNIKNDPSRSMSDRIYHAGLFEQRKQSGAGTYESKKPLLTKKFFEDKIDATLKEICDAYARDCQSGARTPLVQAFASPENASLVKVDAKGNRTIDSDSLRNRLKKMKEAELDAMVVRLNPNAYVQKVTQYESDSASAAIEAHRTLVGKESAQKYAEQSAPIIKKEIEGRASLFKVSQTSASESLKRDAPDAYSEFNVHDRKEIEKRRLQGQKKLVEDITREAQAKLSAYATQVHKERSLRIAAINDSIPELEAQANPAFNSLLETNLFDNFIPIRERVNAIAREPIVISSVLYMSMESRVDEIVDQEVSLDEIVECQYSAPDNHVIVGHTAIDSMSNLEPFFDSVRQRLYGRLDRIHERTAKQEYERLKASGGTATVSEEDGLLACRMINDQYNKDSTLTDLIANEINKTYHSVENLFEQVSQLRINSLTTDSSGREKQSKPGVSIRAVVESSLREIKSLQEQIVRLREFAAEERAAYNLRHNSRLEKSFLGRVTIKESERPIDALELQRVSRLEMAVNKAKEHLKDENNRFHAFENQVRMIAESALKRVAPSHSYLYQVVTIEQLVKAGYEMSTDQFVNFCENVFNPVKIQPQQTRLNKATVEMNAYAENVEKVIHALPQKAQAIADAVKIHLIARVLLEEYYETTKNDVEKVPEEADKILQLAIFLSALPIDQLNELMQACQKTIQNDESLALVCLREQLGGAGLDRDAYREYVLDLMMNGVSTAQIEASYSFLPQFISELEKISIEGSTLEEKAQFTPVRVQPINSLVQRKPLTLTGMKETIRRKNDVVERLARIALEGGEDKAPIIDYVEHNLSDPNFLQVTNAIFDVAQALDKNEFTSKQRYELRVAIGKFETDYPAAVRLPDIIKSRILDIKSRILEKAGSDVPADFVPYDHLVKLFDMAAEGIEKNHLPFGEKSYNILNSEESNRQIREIFNFIRLEPPIRLLENPNAKSWLKDSDRNPYRLLLVREVLERIVQEKCGRVENTLGQSNRVDKFHAAYKNAKDPSFKQMIDRGLVLIKSVVKDEAQLNAIIWRIFGEDLAALPEIVSASESVAPRSGVSSSTLTSEITQAEIDTHRNLFLKILGFDSKKGKGKDSDKTSLQNAFNAIIATQDAKLIRYLFDRTRSVSGTLNESGGCTAPVVASQNLHKIRVIFKIFSENMTDPKAKKELLNAAQLVGDKAYSTHKIKIDDQKIPAEVKPQIGDTLSRGKPAQAAASSSSAAKPGLKLTIKGSIRKKSKKQITTEKLEPSEPAIAKVTSVPPTTASNLSSSSSSAATSPAVSQNTSGAGVGVGSSSSSTVSGAPSSKKPVKKISDKTVQAVNELEALIAGASSASGPVESPLPPQSVSDVEPDRFNYENDQANLKEILGLKKEEIDLDLSDALKLFDKHTAKVNKASRNRLHDLLINPDPNNMTPSERAEKIGNIAELIRTTLANFKSDVRSEQLMIRGKDAFVNALQQIAKDIPLKPAVEKMSPVTTQSEVGEKSKDRNASSIASKPAKKSKALEASSKSSKPEKKPKDLKKSSASSQPGRPQNLASSSSSSKSRKAVNPRKLKTKLMDKLVSLLWAKEKVRPIHAIPVSIKTKSPNYEKPEDDPILEIFCEIFVKNPEMTDILLGKLSDAPEKVRLLDWLYEQSESANLTSEQKDRIQKRIGYLIAHRLNKDVLENPEAMVIANRYIDTDNGVIRKEPPKPIPVTTETTPVTRTPISTPPASSSGPVSPDRRSTSHLLLFGQTVLTPGVVKEKTLVDIKNEIDKFGEKIPNTAVCQTWLNEIQEVSSKYSDAKQVPLLEDLKTKIEILAGPDGKDKTAAWKRAKEILDDPILKPTPEAGPTAHPRNF